jgi:hypothetical protein
VRSEEYVECRLVATLGGDDELGIGGGVDRLRVSSRRLCLDWG